VTAVDRREPDDAPLLDVAGLRVEFQSGNRRVPAVRGVSFSVRAGECLAIVGESGSGKSVTARTLLGLAGDTASVQADRLVFDGLDLLALGPREWAGVRSRRIGLVLQDALVAMDPLRKVGQHVAEPLRAHGLVRRRDAWDRAVELLAEVELPEPAHRVRQYPHQLSGGQRQRALIASAIAAQPALLVADEPTTALDVTVQARILDLLAARRRAGVALLLVSHDLSVVAGLADRVAVMVGGEIVETGTTADVLRRPRHAYTRELLAAVPEARPRRGAAPPRPPAPRAPEPSTPEPSTPEPSTLTPSTLTASALTPSELPPGTLTSSALTSSASEPGLAGARPPALEAVGLQKRYRLGGDALVAVDDVSFQLRAGETLGLVGESGSGKTTTARIALGLVVPDAGEVRLEGAAWSGIPERERRARRGVIQAIYQDPYSSLDPRWTVARIVGEAVREPGRSSARDRRARVATLLGRVQLSLDLLDRRSHELSGGQRQRVAIARAIASRPRVLVCDEPVSALDVTIQAQILDLLIELRAADNLAMLFISHDLGVIRYISDRVAVMRDGRVVETGEAEAVFAAPRATYTRDLLAAIPSVHWAGPDWEPEPGPDQDLAVRPR
jgi:peptide/nickel transport system ATP-binding protein